MSRYLVLILVLAACKDDSSEVKEDIYSRYIWYKTPAEIKATIENLGLYLQQQEENELFIDLGLAYGGSNQHGKVLLGERPTVLYTLAIAKVAWWLSGRLMSNYGGSYQPEQLFHAGITAPDEQGCFSDTSQQWCDFDDQLKIDTYKLGDAESLTSADRKKIMHNMQDIGDRLGVIIDNLTTMEGHNHLPHYLLEEVFIPNLTDEGDRSAWRAVVYTILLRGPFFMNLEAIDRQGGIL